MNSVYILNNFIKHYHSNIYSLFKDEQKTEPQKMFELYLKENNVLIVDYIQLFNQRYFDTIKLITQKYSENEQAVKKKFVLYNTLDCTYRSEISEFYTWNLPKKSNLQIYKNLYDYLFSPSLRTCSCGINEVYFYCLECKRYYCKQCTQSSLKWLILGWTDKAYIRCKCGKINFLYNLPSHYDF